MIYFVTALGCEAKPLIRTYGMKRRNIPCRYEIYENLQENTALVVTGIGKENAVGAVSFLLGLYQKQGWDKDSLLVNIGICGSQNSDVIGSYQCIKVCEEGNRRDLYPEWQPELPLPCGQLFSARRVVQEAAELQTGLVDMEGYGVMWAASGFLMSHQIVIIKTVSDHLEDAATVTAKQAEQMIEALLPVVKKWLDQKLAAVKGLLDKSGKQELSVQELVYQVAESLCASAAMRNQLQQVVQYGMCAAPEQTVDVLAGFLEQPEGAARNRREGKKQLERLLAELQQLPLKPQFTERKPHYGHWQCIYVEERAMAYPRTKRWLERFPKAQIIPIRHYKDVFNRNGKQSYHFQKGQQSLILAVKEGELVYPGAPMCHRFGSESFYYTSCAMNCVFDCEYCYLQGMYPSGHMVLFVNLEDMFQEAVQKAEGREMYLSVSFDTDLMALEGVFGLASEWVKFAKNHPNILIELRTKSNGASFFQHWDENGLSPVKNVVLAWSLSPQEVIEAYEHGTGNLENRLQAVCRAMELGWKVRLCFDPMLYFSGWEQAYEALVKRVAAVLPGLPEDVSIGVFRISQDYLKRMRRQRPDSAVVQYPYDCIGGNAQYDEDLQRQMMDMMCRLLQEQLSLPKEKIFVWHPEKNACIS